MSTYMTRYRNQMTPCSKKGCDAPRFMDTDRCFDHYGIPGGGFFKAWFAFCALLALVMIAFMLWGGYELVTWVTSK